MQERRDEINISHIEIGSTAGGLGILFVAAVVAYNLPGLRWLAFMGAGGGVIAGALAILWKRLKRRG